MCYCFFFHFFVWIRLILFAFNTRIDRF
jgi:hypothetical protein